MTDVLFVSKPVAPPWNDSNKNLVRDVSQAMSRYRAHVMVPRGIPLEAVQSEPIYTQPGEYAPSRWANARVLARLVMGPRADIWHFFFAPNPLTLRAGRVARMVRRTRTVHTIASAPDDLEHVAPMLFADRVIVLSEHTRARLQRVGINALHVPPALGPVTVRADAIRDAKERHGLPERYVLFAGDLEFGDGAETFVACAARAPELGWVVASRPKTARAADALTRLRSAAQASGAPIVWLGATSDIHALVAGATMVSLVSNTLHAKMDWPLVLLEALSLGVPVLVAEETAAAELVASGGATAVRAGNADAVVASVRAWEALSRERQGDVSQRSAAWVRTVCAPSAVAQAHEALYDELLGEKR